MKNTQDYSLSKLLKVYAIKRVKAQRELTAQQTLVNETQDELSTRHAKVGSMRKLITDAIEFAARPEIRSNPKRLVEAEKYRRWTNYDLEREVYYLDLTQEELTEYLEELEDKKQALAKVDIHIEKLKDRQTEYKISREVIREQLAEEEIETLTTANQLAGA